MTVWTVCLLNKIRKKLGVDHFHYTNFPFLLSQIVSKSPTCHHLFFIPIQTQKIIFSGLSLAYNVNYHSLCCATFFVNMEYIQRSKPQFIDDWIVSSLSDYNIFFNFKCVLILYQNLDIVFLLSVVKAVETSLKKKLGPLQRSAIMHHILAHHERLTWTWSPPVQHCHGSPTLPFSPSLPWGFVGSNCMNGQSRDECHSSAQSSEGAAWVCHPFKANEPVMSMAASRGNTD